MPASGPVLSGCQVSSSSSGGGGRTEEEGGSQSSSLTLTLRFDSTLQKGEHVTFNSSNTIAAEDTALYVLVNDSAFRPRFVL